jgi:hypothetical protein
MSDDLEKLVATLCLADPDEHVSMDIIRAMAKAVIDAGWVGP